VDCARSGGTAKQLTFHSADDNRSQLVAGTASPCSRIQSERRLFGDALYRLARWQRETKAETDFGTYGCFSPDGKQIAVNRKGQPYWRKGYRGSYQTDVTVVDLKSKAFRDVTSFLGMDTWPMWGRRRAHLFRQRSRRQANATLRVPEGGGETNAITTFKDGVCGSVDDADGKTIVLNAIFVVEARCGDAEARGDPHQHQRRDAGGLTEYRTVNSDVDDYDVAADGPQMFLASVRGELFLCRREEGDLTQLTKGSARDRVWNIRPMASLIAFVSDQESGREEIFVIPADGSAPPRRVTDIDALKYAYTGRRTAIIWQSVLRMASSIASAKTAKS